jgi:uncharacterized protein YkwD
MKSLIILATVFAASAPAAHAGEAEQLLALVNAWRAAPATCQGRMRPAVPALAPQRLLSGIALRPRTILLSVLDQAGYNAEVADAVNVEGPTDARAAFEALRESYCATLGSTRYSDIGAHQAGNEWTVVLATPVPNPVELLPNLDTSAREVLDATNTARATGRQCGDTWMGAAPPVAWNAQLAAAALAHSQDMAEQSYFSHVNRRRQEVPQRAEAQGYSWRNIAENISRGQVSAQEAVNGWINSPGHCKNLMNPRFTEMGAGVAIHQAKHPNAYWTQVFATPR